MRMILASVLVFSLAAPSWVRAGDSSILSGRVLPSSRGEAPTKVWVGAIAAPVLADGTFRAEGVPAGPAELAIETSEGFYVVPTPVAIAPGTTRSVQLAFGGRQNSSAPASPEKPKKKKSGGVWSNPLYATLIVVGSAIVVGVAVDQLTKSNTTTVPVSPSAPTN